MNCPMLWFGEHEYKGTMTPGGPINGGGGLPHPCKNMSAMPSPLKSAKYMLYPLQSVDWDHVHSENPVPVDKAMRLPRPEESPWRKRSALPSPLKSAIWIL